MYYTGTLSALKYLVREPCHFNCLSPTTLNLLVYVIVCVYVCEFEHVDCCRSGKIIFGPVSLFAPSLLHYKDLIKFPATALLRGTRLHPLTKRIKYFVYSTSSLFFINVDTYVRTR